MELDLKKCEAVTLTGATIYICHADSTKSVGFLRLDPKGSLPKHNRPVEEWLVQVEGSSVMRLFENDLVVKEVTLRRGDSLRIPANQYHQHTNQSEAESLTSWHFDGDITGVIAQIRDMGQ